MSGRTGARFRSIAPEHVLPRGTPPVLGYGGCAWASIGGDAVSIRRLSIQCDGDGQPVAVDVALPAGMPVAALLPAIVELAGQPSSRHRRGAGDWTASADRHWTSRSRWSTTTFTMETFWYSPRRTHRRSGCCSGIHARRSPMQASSPEAGSVRSEVACVWAAVVGSLALCSGAAGTVDDPPADRRDRNVHRRWLRHRRPQCRNGSRIGAAGRGGRISRRAVGPRCGERIPCGRGRGHHVAADAALDRRRIVDPGGNGVRSRHWSPSARSRRWSAPSRSPPWVPHWPSSPSGCWRYPAASRFCCPGWPPIGRPTTPTHVRSAATPP